MGKSTIIAEFRKRAGYTQKKLANILNVSDKAVSKWERGLSQPDISLLTKISSLLDIDIELLTGTKENNDEWIGLIDLVNYDIDFSVTLYDKPLVYYLLVHFLLLGITDIYIRTTKNNEEYLSNSHIYEEFGFTFTFDFLDLPECNVMILNKPYFIFGSDLTRQFRNAMSTKSTIKLVPHNQECVFLFCPSFKSFMYLKNSKYLYSSASTKNLGRGVITIKLVSIDNLNDVSNFIRIYQSNSNNLIASLEEVYYNNKKIIDENH